MQLEGSFKGPPTYSNAEMKSVRGAYASLGGGNAQGGPEAQSQASRRRRSSGSRWAGTSEAPGFSQGTKTTWSRADMRPLRIGRTLRVATSRPASMHSNKRPTSNKLSIAPVQKIGQAIRV